MKIFGSDLFPRCESFFRWFFSDQPWWASSGMKWDWSPSMPDLLIFGDFGNDYLKFTNSKKIYYTGENIRPNFSICDFALTFDRLEDSRHYRLPLYIIENYSRWAEYKSIPSFDYITNPRGAHPTDLLRSKPKFCNFIVSNPNCPIRDEFFRKLSLYRKVDSAGSHLNNMDFTLPKEPEHFFSAKLEFQKEYKFSIAFENSSYPGYVTEKILDPFLANSIPIYWGDPLVHLDFNQRAFINANSFKTMDELVDWVIKVDLHGELSAKYLQEPPLRQNEMAGPWDLYLLKDFFLQMIKKKDRPAESVVH